jgi:hypothetical protein
VNRHLDAVRRAATVVDVPGTPRTLRLDSVGVERGVLRLRWSFLDPEGLPGDPRPPVRRIHGETVSADATRAWSEAQLAAAHRFKSQVDADWLPGEPYVHRVWTVEEAWQGLLDHLAAGGAAVRVGDGEILVTRGNEIETYRIDPAEWAAFLTGPAPADDDPYVLLAAHPTVDGLPLWAVDELDEAMGAWGPVVALVDGELVGVPHPGGAL